jgi:hypothetical protein
MSYVNTHTSYKIIEDTYNTVPVYNSGNTIAYDLYLYTIHVNLFPLISVKHRSLTLDSKQLLQYSSIE